MECHPEKKMEIKIVLIKLYVVYNLPNKDNMWSAALKTDGIVIKILLHK